ncbi:hypothetical protein DW998_13165 [Parabacteroides distasonis]|nr:hypothetical protein DW998_13165 [Parabacteroides distasonis]
MSRGYNLFTAYLKDLISKIRIQMEKNMRMKFLKQRITVILLLVASVCICGSINEFYVFENDYYFIKLSVCSSIYGMASKRPCRYAFSASSPSRKSL